MMLLDNKTHGKIIDAIKQEITPQSKISILSGWFSIHGYYALKKELSTLKDMRLMLSQWDDEALQNLVGSVSETGLKNKLNQSYIAKECADWIKKSADVQMITKAALISTQNLFHIQNTAQSLAIQGSSHFTAAGIGAVKSDRIDMNMGTDDIQTSAQLLQWFNSIWHDKNSVKNIKDDLIAKLNYIAQDKPAHFIYFITLYNIFKAFLEDIDEESIIRSKTGFKDTIIWNKLYKFQRDGVLGAIDKLEKYNGCIIADSVGLGKTFEALAVIKYYELRNDRILVLCPKKLRENWTVYTINDKRNLLSEDRFHYDVLNHTDLSRSKGKSGEINLETLNWGNYDLIVIDESHNFRNTGTKADGITRYKKLMDMVIKAGVKTKVLMLSATPVNNRMNDLKNQVAFITEGKDTALRDYGVSSIENTLRKAQTKFNEWLKLPEEERKADVLLANMNFDYFKLLDLCTIARSRKHIEKYYDVAEIGKFPQRLKPLNIKSDIDSSGQFPPLKEVNTSIKRLKLAAYSPLEYVRIDKKEAYSRKYDQQVKGGTSVFHQVDRERSLVHLMRVNLLKRMESSIHSFTQTVTKIHGKISGILQQIDQHENSEFEALSIEDIQIDDPALEDYLIGNKTKVLLQDMDIIRWRQELEADLFLLQDLMDNAQNVKPSRDAKLSKLKDVLTEKSQNPINAGNRKAIIFTAFSDTAEYLYQHIAAWAQSELGLHSALITGSGTNSCTIKGISKELNSLLTHFSPISKERHKIDPDTTTQIDILIATDCISEGQNLQDCDLLINYDIHWNPVRIIQRFGRVDRLGSKNDAIQLANFWPNMELDEYINLEARVSGRMVLLDISATGEENVIDYDETKQMNDLEYRRKQMKQLQDSVLDLEDMDGSVSITDMTLNDFRMDLSGYIQDHLPALEQAPTGFFAAIPADSTRPAGAIFCLRDRHNKVNHDPHYALAPYYFVYVTDDGHIALDHSQSKKILDIIKKLAALYKQPEPSAIATLHATCKHGRDMEKYQYLLECAIQSITGKSEETGMQSLFSRGGTQLSNTGFSAFDDFEVVSYFIITPNITEGGSA